MQHSVIIPSEQDRKSANRLMWTALYPAEQMEDIPYYHRPPINWAYVIKDGEEVVSTISFCTNFPNQIRGVELPIAGVWGVATAPTHRGAGMARSLFTIAHQKMKEEGIVLAVLDPRSVQLYEKLGYANAEERVCHTFTPSLFRKVDESQQLQVYRVTNEDEIAKVIQVERAMARLGSRLFKAENSIGGSHLFLVERDGEPVGTVNFSVTQKGDAEVLQVSSVAYTSDDVLPTIIKLIANFASQCQQVRWMADPQIPVQHFLTERKHLQTEEKGSMMMRVIDFVGFCEQIQIPEKVEEAVLVQIEDQDCPWNNGLYRLSPEQGKLRVEEITTSDDATAEVVLSGYQVSQVISGLSPATLLQSFGQITCTPEVAQRLEAIFPADNFIAYMRF